MIAQVFESTVTYYDVEMRFKKMRRKGLLFGFKLFTLDQAIRFLLL